MKGKYRIPCGPFHNFINFYTSLSHFLLLFSTFLLLFLLSSLPPLPSLPPSLPSSSFSLYDRDEDQPDDPSYDFPPTITPPIQLPSAIANPYVIGPTDDPSPPPPPPRHSINNPGTPVLPMFPPRIGMESPDSLSSPLSRVPLSKTPPSFVTPTKKSGDRPK